MRIIAGLIVFMLLFGCFGGGEVTPPEGNKTNETNQTGPPVTIIIGNQTNQTTGGNATEEQPPPPPPPPEGLQYEYNPDQMFGVYFIDVGGPGLQGDAILIKKGDLDVLVDAGSAEKSGKVVDFLRSKAVDDIEVLISTAADPRRYGGMDAVADAFTIEEVWWSDDSFGDANYSAVMERMGTEARDVKRVEEGFSMDLNGMNFTVLNPPKTARFDDVNNDAIVLRIADRNVSLLLTSDVQGGAQGQLINTKPDDIKVDILQAPYYGVGVGTSNMGIFLIKSDPDVVIISGSSDESAVNGGSREPFKRLMTQYGIPYYENYVNGSIRVSSDGQEYTIQSLGKGS
ncbi:MAG: MBL fold metallo-hydrolase [Candidatus ainarchaeum sp.]|nr:MBL fold metallo-hydrolase [Candidatus ainarchaeum sp.]